MSDEPMMDEQQQEGAPMQEIRVEDVLLYTIRLFSEQAWIYLGLHANPGTGETKEDLPQAKLAIDALAALIPLSEGHFSPHEVRDLKNLLSSLQLNYVQRKTAQSS